MRFREVREVEIPEERLDKEIEILGDGIGESRANPNPSKIEILGDGIGEGGY